MAQPPSSSTGLGISLSRPNVAQYRAPNPFNSATPKPVLVRPANHAHKPSTSSSAVTMRSTMGMNGLLEAERGSAMVELNPAQGGSGFKVGRPIDPTFVTPSMQNMAKIPSSISLDRQPTLLTRDASPQRNAAELKSILGNSAAGRLQANATVAPSTGATRIRKRAQSAPSAPNVVTLEQAKPKARVEIDIILESDASVEGGYMTGHLLVTVQKTRKDEGQMWLGGGKVRVVGFEGK